MMAEKLISELKNIPGLALEHLADSLKSRKSYSSPLAGLENRQIGLSDANLLCQLSERDIFLSH